MSRASSLIIRPSGRLTRLSAATAAGALVAMVAPILILPVIASALIVATLTALDWRASHGESAPEVERIVAPRLIKGSPAKILYRISRAGGRTHVSLLDELPTELGGDLILDGVALASGPPVEVERMVEPRKRGKYALGALIVAWRSQLGLLRLRTTRPGEGTVAIIPQTAPPDRRDPLSHRSLVEELGVKSRPKRGEGGEFESLREYADGDDPRLVDWRATARRGRLMVRQLQTERHHTVIVAVDTGRLMAGRVAAETKLDHAIECAIALARASSEFGDRIGLLGFDRELRVIARPAIGKKAVNAMISASLELRPYPFEPDYRVLVEALARHQGKRALVIVLTDFVEGGASRGLEAWVRVLARRHYVMLVAMRDPLMNELERPAPEITRAGLYRRLALQDLAAERETALGRIRRFGVQTLDLEPGRINGPVLNRYLAMRQGVPL